MKQKVKDFNYLCLEKCIFLIPYQDSCPSLKINIDYRKERESKELKIRLT